MEGRMGGYPVITFNQFGSDTSEDRLLLFAAPARAIRSWAGIPRKGWRIRMLFQRWITDVRRAGLWEFLGRGSTPDRTAGESFILGPTAITVALLSEPVLESGRIVLDYTPVVDLADNRIENLRALAAAVLPSIAARLSAPQRAILSEFERDAKA